MKFCLVAFLSFCFCTMWGQNLVPNPGFEEYKRLPCYLNQFFLQDLLVDWLQPIRTTSDYWNSLADPDCNLKPSSSTVLPRTGSGMAAMITADISNGVKEEYKEYLEVALKDKLKEGHLYNVAFYAAGQKEKLFNNVQPMEANNLGIAFSSNLIQRYFNAQPTHLLMNATIKAKDVVPTDRNWHKIEGCFISDSSYQYLLVGNFDHIDSTTTQLIAGAQGNEKAYYFVDDVMVEELPYDVASLKNSVTMCDDEQSVELTAFVDGAIGYVWDDGSTSPTMNIAERVDKEYAVTISFNECSYKHSFKVNYVPDIFLGNDTTLCQGETLKLKPDYPFNEFEWSDGTTDSVKYVTAPGLYEVKTLSNDCLSQDSMKVDYLDCPGFVPNIITPNSDDYNEYFTFENIESRVWSLQIFNRWGEQVYYSAYYQNNWDGKDLPTGIYYYKLSSEGLKTVNGWVHVYR